MRMQKFLLSAVVLVAFATSAVAEQTPIKQIQSTILNSQNAHDNLRELTKGIGPRLSGSSKEAEAVNWAEAKLQSFGLTSVTREAVQVPHWERGHHEVAYFEYKAQRVTLDIAALGRSTGTTGLDAQVVEVKSLDELRKLGSSVKDKIVFFNRPMDPTLPNTFEAYAGAVDQRSSGPSMAANFGAVAALVRSMTTLTDDVHPHTGASRFSGIPAAALSTRSANLLSEALTTTPDLKVHIELSAQNNPDVTSYNIIGEIRGSEKPEEIVLVGGHLDSWDLGEGAHDDGAGVVQSMEVCRVVAQLRLQPKRTIRCVLFAAEESGGIGGEAYAAKVRDRGEKHIMAIESDRGGFDPVSISIDGNDEQVAQANTWINDFKPLGMTDFFKGWAGTDVDPLKDLGALTMEIAPVTTHYFDYHHAATDRFEAVDPISLAKGAAAMATIVWHYSNQP
jgi:hypothetical protein